MVELKPLDGFEKMILEYKNMNIFPSGHAVEQFRPYLPSGTIDIKSAKESVDGEKIKSRENEFQTKVHVFVSVLLSFSL